MFACQFSVMEIKIVTTEAGAFGPSFIRPLFIITFELCWRSHKWIFLQTCQNSIYPKPWGGGGGGASEAFGGYDLAPTLATFILSFYNCLPKLWASFYRQLASMHMYRIFLLKTLLLTYYIIMVLYCVSTSIKWPLSTITLCVFCSKLAQGSASMYYNHIDHQQGIKTCAVPLQAFLCLTVHCAALRLAEYERSIPDEPGRPRLLPAAICDALALPQQQDWWQATHCLYTNSNRFVHATLVRKVAIERNGSGVELRTLDWENPGSNPVLRC